MVPRRREALAGGFEARFAAAWWAIENGLTTEAAAEVRELHRLDPKHAPTARMAAVLDRLGEAVPRSRLQRAFRRRSASKRAWHVGRT